MSTKTPNVRLNIIPFDQDPWDADANENTSIIDALLGQYIGVPNFQGVWKNSTNYLMSQVVVDANTGTQWVCNIGHASSASPVLFSDDRLANPSYWTQTGSSTAENAASAATSAAQAQQNVGRSLVHNGMFRIRQRGIGPWTTNGYTADRWRVDTNLDTFSASIVAFNDAQRVQIGDEEAAAAYVIVVTGNVGAASFSILSQPIESVRRLANKTVTISFMANSASGTPKIGVGLRQFFGTGGSPSAFVDMPAVPVTLTTTPTRYRVTQTLPSASGKTLGSNVDNYTRLAFWLSSGATNNTVAGGIGVQANTFAFWGIQLEIGTVDTQLEKPDPQVDLANCQRFAEGMTIDLAGYAAGSLVVQQSYQFAVTKRGAPTLTLTDAGTPTNATGLTLDHGVPAAFRAWTQATGTGVATVAQFAVLASADL